MLKKKMILCLAVIVIILTTFLLWPQAQNLEKYQRAYDRGQYEQVIDGLQRQLKKHPGWFEARELVLAASIALGRLDQAWEQVWALHRDGYSTGQYRSRMEEILRSEDLDCRCEELAAGLMKNCFSEGYIWDWGLTFYIKLLEKRDDKAELRRILIEYSSDASTELRYTLNNTLLYLREDLDPHEAWAISTILDEGGAMAMRSYLLDHMADEATIESLQRQFPHDALLASALASCKDPDEGLEFLRAWEDNNAIEYADEQEYYSQKALLIAQCHKLAQEDLAGLNQEMLLQAAIDTAPWPSKCQLIIAELANHYPNKVVIDELRELMGGDKPLFTLKSGSFHFLSPDGNWLIYYHHQWKLINTANQEEISLSAQIGNTTWQWAPDSQHAVSIDYSFLAPKTNYLVDLNGNYKVIELSAEDYSILGWRDNSTLWLHQTSLPSTIPAVSFVPERLGKLMLYNIEIGTIQTPPLSIEGAFADFYPGPNGALAQRTPMGFQLYWGDNLRTANSPDFSYLISWQPDGKAVIFGNGEGEMRLFSQEGLVTLLETGQFLGWQNPQRFYLCQNLRFYEMDKLSSSHYRGTGLITLYSGLYTYDLEKGMAKEKIYGYIASAAGKTVIVDLLGYLRIFRLP